MKQRCSVLVVAVITALLMTSALSAKGTGRAPFRRPPSHSAGGKTAVRGYTKKDGTHVAPHHRTAPNGTQRDNWSAKGNTNPVTGKAGTKTPQKD